MELVGRLTYLSGTRKLILHARLCPKDCSKFQQNSPLKDQMSGNEIHISEELELEAGSYTSSPQICTSDHSPVGAIFRMSVTRPYHIFETASDRRIFIRLSRLSATGLGPGDHHISFRAQYCDEDKHTSNATSKHGKATFHTVVLTTKRGVCSRKWLQSRHVLVAIYKVDDALETAHM